ncbi:uncharacterized protein LOC124343977 [Daphnia pulicaria]|uniref:uncharacterized protein LOC124343977 n=1 Tax=Daphnia pulicaria TaxID=35523 RepID=UPI001EEC047B|nr:uncharacterized protein LOC124343977 [Daphnia pulicaria]
MARRKKGVGSVEKDMGRSTVNYRPAKRRRSQQPVRFSNYVFKVLKQVHPQLSMTNKAMKVMDDFMHDIYSRLVSEAAGLVKLTKRSTLSASEFQTATRLILPGELAKHAISEASKAVASFLTSRNDDAKRSHARRVINNPPTMPVTGNNQEPVEIEIFGTVPRPLLSNARQVTEQGDVEESMEEDELVKSIDLQRETSSNAPLVDRNLQIENTNQIQNVPDSRTKQVVPIETAQRDVTSGLSEENISDEEIAATTEEQSGPPTPPTEGESDMSIVISETSKQTEVDDDKRQDPLNDEKMKTAEEAETAPMDEEAETEPMDEEAETGPINLQSTSGREVEPNSLLIVNVGSIQESSSLISAGSTISTQLMSISNTIASADTGNVSYPEPFTQEPLSGRNEAVMTDSGISTGRATSEASQLTVRCSTITSTKTTYMRSAF